MTATRKLVLTAILFGVALGIAAIAAVADTAGPLFAVWLPLVAVAWVLSRPEPGDPTPEPRVIDDEVVEAVDEGPEPPGAPGE